MATASIQLPSPQIVVGGTRENRSFKTRIPHQLDEGDGFVKTKVPVHDHADDFVFVRIEERFAALKIRRVQQRARLSTFARQGDIDDQGTFGGPLAIRGDLPPRV